MAVLGILLININALACATADGAPGAGGPDGVSNYLMHSVAGVVIFYGIGFGLFGRLSLTAAVFSGLAFFILQMLLSRWWLRRAQFGPAEWLWRMFTYRRLNPLFKPE